MHNLFKYNIEVPDKFHHVFLKTFGLIEASKEEIKKDRKKKDAVRSLLFKRKHILNSKFEFTKENILKFEVLSNKLTTIQAQILAKHKYIVDKAMADLIENGGTLIDLEINISVSFFIDWHEAIDPIYVMDDVFAVNLLYDTDTLEHINKSYADYEGDCGEAKIKFAHFHQSRLFHHLFHEGYLALQDILLITTVWYDIIIEHQTQEIL